MNFPPTKLVKISKNSMEYLKLKQKILDQKMAFRHPFKVFNDGVNVEQHIIKKIDIKKQKNEIDFSIYKEPLISFIVPVYNVSKYISRCLDSILNQTIKNIEIIVVNDGSTDGVELILNEYQEKYKNIKVIHQKNKGVSNARNVGIENSNGLYLSFIDGDDVVKYEMSEYLLKRCLSYDLDACYFEYQLIDINSHSEINQAYSFKHYLNQYIFERVISPCDIKLSILNNSMATGIYKRKIFLDNNLKFDEELKNGEDCIIKFDNFYLFKKIMFVNRIFYIYYRNRDDSATSNINNYVSNLIIFFDKLIKIFLKKIIEDNFNIELLNVILREITYYALKYKCPQIDNWCRKNLYLIDPELLNNRNINTSYIAKLKKIIDINISTDKFKNIDYYRSKVDKSYYIVTGQLNSITNEPIDSWSFFKYLKEHNVNAIYVCWKQHSLYKTYKNMYPDSVIGTNGNCIDNLELLSPKLFPYIIRAKYLVQENVALNYQIRKYVYNCKDLQLVFLGHGLTVSSDITMVSFINIYNVSSKAEKDFIKNEFKYGKLTDKNFVIGGLPRLDYLNNEYNDAYKYAFIMFTWRSTLDDIYKIKNSDYIKNILNLLNKENVDKLINNDIIPILSIHHHILNKYGLKLNLDNRIKLADSLKISDYIKKSFACVSDFSSVSFDFRFLNKPVIYWIPDLKSKTLGQRDLDKQQICLQRLSKFKDNVNSSDEVIDKIIYYSNNPTLSQDKIKLNDTLFKYKTNISKHIYEQLETKYNS